MRIGGETWMNHHKETHHLGQGNINIRTYNFKEQLSGGRGVDSCHMTEPSEGPFHWPPQNGDKHIKVHSVICKIQINTSYKCANDALITFSKRSAELLLLCDTA